MLRRNCCSTEREGANCASSICLGHRPSGAPVKKLRRASTPAERRRSRGSYSSGGSSECQPQHGHKTRQPRFARGVFPVTPHKSGARFSGQLQRIYGSGAWSPLLIRSNSWHRFVVSGEQQAESGNLLCTHLTQLFRKKKHRLPFFLKNCGCQASFFRFVQILPGGCKNCTAGWPKLHSQNPLCVAFCAAASHRS